MKKTPATIRNTPGILAILLAFCLALGLVLGGCSLEQEDLEKALAEEDNPLTTIQGAEETLSKEDRFYASIMSVERKDADSLRVNFLEQQLSDKDGEISFESLGRATITDITPESTLVYATMSNPGGTVMDHREFAQNYVEGDDSVFVVYLAEDGTVELLYNYSILTTK